MQNAKKIFLNAQYTGQVTFFTVSKYKIESNDAYATHKSTHFSLQNGSEEHTLTRIIRKNVTKLQLT